MSYEKANDLQSQASVAEVSGNYKQAYDLMTELARMLPGIIASGVPKSDPRRRAKLQQQVVNERLMAIRPFVQNGQGTAPNPLPSMMTAAREILNPFPGTVLLTPVETGRSPAVIVAAGLPDQPDPAVIGATFLTPLLSTSLPDLTYHVYSETQRRSNGTWVYFHVRDDNRTTHYTLAAFKRPRYQIPRIVMSRATEMGGDCAVIDVTPIKPHGDSAVVNGLVGRPLTIRSPAQTTINEKPDRLEKEWTPRRFMYGGKRFVWKEDLSGSTSSMVIQRLYEVEREWPDPNSKTGKLLDQTNGRHLVFMKMKLAMSKVCTITFVGGLDQMFREYLLASMASQLMIQSHGHT